MLPNVIIGISLVLTALVIGCASAAPTLSPLPTYTPYPTLAPLPTYTLYPTNTPYPTYVPLPTQTPYPTYTPFPTPTPEPTFTPTPEPTPTRVFTPTPAATPTPTPVPTVWTMGRVRQDRLTDAQSVTFTTEAISHNAEWPFDAPTLFVRCHSQDGLEVFVNWGGQYIAGRDDRPQVDFRFDLRPVVSERWHESTNNEASFAPNPQIFVNQILKTGAETVYIQLTDYSWERHTAEFKVNGLAYRMSSHPTLCPE